ncbi:MAG: fused MFS/spermidine synthase [Phycisphaeraceae bacterium]|nr:fused MFS/spermidine synthase [Phycisphaeraceae bacterium]
MQWMLLLHAATIFLGAALLFLIQPLFGRLALPRYGGSPAVWNTCMVFFQATLLLGYLVVHLTARCRPRVQFLTVVVLFVLAAFALPPGISAERGAIGEGSPIPDLLRALVQGVGLPFLAVTLLSPLLQRWFSLGRHGLSGDPYFLYAASNAGSMVGLLAYPLLVEPWLPVQGQSRLWTSAFALLLVGVVACMISAARAGRPRAEPARSVPVEGPAAPSTRRFLTWMALAAAPSSLLLGVTTFITTDLVVVPLLWVIPLALYLLSFVLVFARHRPIPQVVARRALPIAVIVGAILFASGATEPMWLIVGGHLLVLLVVAIACHGDAAEDRPHPSHLTRFYLALSIGGVLGGAFNALLAPHLFTAITEYPVALLCAALIVGGAARTADGRTAPGFIAAVVRVRTLLPVALVLGLAVALRLVGDHFAVPEGPPRMAVLLAAPMLGAFLLSRNRLRFVAAVGGSLLIAIPALAPPGVVLERSRTFHGVHRVLRTTGAAHPDRPSRTLHRLHHGTTVHGTQHVDPITHRPDQPGTPTAYYARTGPVGDIFSAWRDPGQPRRVGAVGLGAGTIAAYASDGDHFTFHEIDPEVRRIAEDERLFTYLAAGRARGARIDVILGDARLTLRTVEPGRYDLLILDAFSSDSIPVHLLTREALGTALATIADDGLIAVHISNRYLDLEPVVANLAADAGLSALMRDDIFAPPAPAHDPERSSSTWIVLARDERALRTLHSTGAGWRAPRTMARVGVWTDDWSNILRVLGPPPG